MHDISVERIDATTFAVSVTEGPDGTQHTVTVPPDDAARLAPDRRVEDLVRASFEFLLEREPKESILRVFDLPVISRYFPEYETEITRRLR